MHQTLIGSILPEKLSSFHGDATQNLGQCVHYESRKLRDRNLSSSSSCSAAADNYDPNQPKLGLLRWPGHAAKDRAA